MKSVTTGFFFEAVDGRKSTFQDYILKFKLYPLYSNILLFSPTLVGKLLWMALV